MSKSEASEEEKQYEPKDAIGECLTNGGIVGGAGILISAVQNTLTKHNVGPWGVFTRTGGVIAVFAAMGGTFGFVHAASANLRKKDDAWNNAIGGFAAGLAPGIALRTMPAVLGYATLTAVLMGGVEYSGGLVGGHKEPEVDEYARKEELRKRRRRPIWETLEELGEGRGITGPGYEERRRERLKRKYGIEVQSSPSSAE